MGFYLNKNLILKELMEQNIHESVNINLNSENETLNLSQILSIYKNSMAMRSKNCNLNTKCWLFTGFQLMIFYLFCLIIIHTSNGTIHVVHCFFLLPLLFLYSAISFQLVLEFIKKGSETKIVVFNPNAKNSF